MELCFLISVGTLQYTEGLGVVFMVKIFIIPIVVSGV